MDGGEGVVVAFSPGSGFAGPMTGYAGGDGMEVLELVEEAFDQVAVSMEERAERGDAFAVPHGSDAGPCSACSQCRAHDVAVIGAVGKQDVPFAQAVEHIVGRASIMRLAFGQLDPDRQAERINECVDLGRQAAAQATHAPVCRAVTKQTIGTPTLC